MKQDNESLLDRQDLLQKDLQTASDYVKIVESKCFKANNTSLELLEELRRHEQWVNQLKSDFETERTRSKALADAEIETLQAYVADLKTRIPVYLPLKTDETDVELAKWINGYKNRLQMRLLFIRQGEGLYSFGKQQVRLVVQRGIVKVKVGGGHIDLEEYLNQYTPVELEKLEKGDPLKRVGAADNVSTASPIRRGLGQARSMSIAC